jgi:hypothetical protein
MMMMTTLQKKEKSLKYNAAAQLQQLRNTNGSIDVESVLAVWQMSAENADSVWTCPSMGVQGDSDKHVSNENVLR